MAAVAPSMSDRGFIKGPAEKADQLLAWFFVSDAQQTYLYQGSVRNVQDLMQRFGNNIPAITQEMQAALEKLFQAYFDTAIVQVTNNDDPAVNPTGQITLRISAEVTQDGVSYSVNELIQSVNSKFIRVTNYVNTGVLS